jgi:dihydroorotate dehydrogenase
VTRDALGANDPKQTGGLSGVPLHPLSLGIVSQLRKLLGPRYPLIGVGGIDSPATALAMRRAGADLVQLYTGMVYRGPGIVRQCARALRE